MERGRMWGEGTVYLCLCLADRLCSCSLTSNNRPTVLSLFRGCLSVYLTFFVFMFVFHRSAIKQVLAFDFTGPILIRTLLLETLRLALVVSSLVLFETQEA